MPVQRYLFFDGRCQEAIDFYRKALGAEVEMLMRYKEAPDPTPPGTHEGYAGKVMHANLRIRTARGLATFPRKVLSIGFRCWVSRHLAIQATGLLTLTPAGLSPAEHASLRWTHNPAH
jgi:hypothetical protein